MVTYRDIIQQNIKDAIKKRNKCDIEEKQYWDKIIQSLIEDLRDFERGETWHRRTVYPLNIEGMIRQMFEELWENGEY